MAAQDNQVHYSLTLAGETLSCSFSQPDAASFFGPWLSGPFPGPGSVSVPDFFRADWTRVISPWTPHAEYSAFSMPASCALMEHDRFLFHAVALLCHGCAWLICGPSGVGKTTQADTLIREHPGDFAYISGDRPVIEIRGDKQVWIHPSPWNGKENNAGSSSAPLGGIVFLFRGDNNSFESFSPDRAAAYGFSSVLHMGASVEELHRVGKLTDSLLSSVPLWRLTSFDVPSSTHMLFDSVFREVCGYGV